ncbi:hypothetical protein M5E87_09195 [Flavonifractor plautii]|nr:hypothetical protein M5E87_09195 [Flavonifractor plautii]
MIDRIPISRKEEPIHGSLVAIPLCPGPRSALHRRTRHADPADPDRSPLCRGAFDSDGDAGVPDADGPDFDGPDADGGPLHEAAADPETPTPACTCSPCGAWWPSWCSSAGAACGSTR